MIFRKLTNATPNKFMYALNKSRSMSNFQLGMAWVNSAVHHIMTNIGLFLPM